MPTPAPGFDAFNLAAVAADLRETMVGARVQKIQQPAPFDLTLLVYGKSGSQRVLFSIDSKGFRLHRTTQRRENPLHPPMFCLLCRKYIENAFVVSVVQPRFDRLAEITFQTLDGNIRLVAELMGRNANLVLVSSAGLVLGTMRQTPPDSPRPLRPGVAYTYPPGFTDRVDPVTLSGPDDAIFVELPTNENVARRWLTETFSGMGKFAAEEIMARQEAGQDRAVAHSLCVLMTQVQAEQFAPHDIVGNAEVSGGVWAFMPLSVPDINRYPRENISLALDAFYAAQSEETEETGEKAILSKALGKEIAFRRKELASAQATLKEAARAEEYEQVGNNLLANLSLLAKGQATVTIPDLYSETSKTITVALDPKRTPQENAEAYFTRARKARDAAEYATGQVADRTHEIALLIRLQERLEADDDIASIRRELTRLVGEERITGKPEPKPKETKPFGGFRIRTFTVDGFTLLIGETAEANDHLTTRVASPSDWWFHVRAAPGAHGVLRSNGLPDRVPETVLRRAAQIVAARSGTAVKHSDIVAVDMVEKRYVRKPRGAKPGMVTYERERTLDVEPRL